MALSPKTLIEALAADPNQAGARTRLTNMASQTEDPTECALIAERLGQGTVTRGIESGREKARLEAKNAAVNPFARFAPAGMAVAV